MRGLELSEAYFREIVWPICRNALPEDVYRLAFGLVGEGSECMGYDDELSRDHDWGPGCMIWVRDEDWDRLGATVQRIYRDLPERFAGYEPRRTTAQAADRLGAVRISEFYRRYTGCPAGPQTLRQWMAVPEAYLAKAVNGAVFRDDVGEFSAVREHIRGFYPEEVRWKKLAARAVVMAQSGQYNYPRSLRRGDEGAAFFAVREFVQAALSMGHLLEKRYMPYYKWSWRSFLELDLAGSMAEDLKILMTSPMASGNIDRIEGICRRVKERWLAEGLVQTDDDYLEPLAWELYGRISAEDLKMRHIMDG